MNTSKSYYVYSSLKGTQRRENQDSFVIIDEKHYSLFAVFDGVGGAKNGRQASQFAKNFIKDNFSKYIDGVIKLKELMYDLNKALAGSEFFEAYSTYCLVLIDKTSGTIYYSWLGDSRIYEIGKQFMEPITEDDSSAKNVITKFLGDEDLHPSEIRMFTTHKEDKHLLLCTDGFYHLLESDKFSFFKQFQKKSMAAIKENVKSLIKGKNADDSTFIFIR